MDFFELGGVMVKTALNFLNDLKGLSGGDKTVLCYFSSDNRSRFFKEFDGKIDLNKNFNIYSKWSLLSR